MLVAAPYIGRFGLGYAIISRDAEILAGEAPESRSLGRIKPPHISTERVDAVIYSMNDVTLSDHELEDVSGTLENNLSAFIRSENRKPEHIDWTSFAKQAGGFGLAYVDRQPTPRLYGIEADSSAQRIERFDDLEGAKFYDESQILLSMRTIDDTISRFPGGFLDDTLRQLTRTKPWSSGPLSIIYATDLGSFSERIDPTE